MPGFVAGQRMGVAGSAYADGMSGAPTGSVQFANILDNYPTGVSPAGRSKINGCQPPWNVAGVDYYVGIDRAVYATDGALKDFLSGGVLNPSFPAGCALNAADSVQGNNGTTCVRVSAGSGTVNIDGWDFSLHNGYLLVIDTNFTGTCNVTNCNFAIGSNTVPMFSSWSKTGTINVDKSNFDCNNRVDTSGQGANIAFLGGTVRSTYCYHKKFAGKCYLVSSNGGALCTAVIKYNLESQGNWGSDEHNETIQIIAGATSVIYNFNMLYQPDGDTATGRPGSINSGFYSVGNNTVGNIAASECAYNTVVGVGSNHDAGGVNGTATGTSTGTTTISLTGSNNSLLISGAGSIDNLRIFGGPIPAGTSILPGQTPGASSITVSNNVPSGSGFAITSWQPTNLAINAAYLIATPGANVVTGTTTNASNSVAFDATNFTNITANTDGTINGRALFGSSGDIPAGATIVSNNSGAHTIAMSAPATAGNTETITIRGVYANINPSFHDNYLDWQNLTSGNSPPSMGSNIAAGTYPNSPYWYVVSPSVVNNVLMRDGSILNST